MFGFDIVLFLMSVGFLIPECQKLRRRNEFHWPLFNSVGLVIVLFGLSWNFLNKTFKFDSPSSEEIRDCICYLGIIMTILRIFYYLAISRRFGPIALTLVEVLGTSQSAEQSLCSFHPDSG